MPFLPDTWKAKVSECLWEWRLRFAQARPAAVYTTLSAAALWPLVQAAQSDGLLPVALALGHVVAGAGGNLIAEQLQCWHDQAQPPLEADVDAWIAAHIITDTALRQELDTILERLQVISQAQERLPANDRQWFAQTLRTELVAIGNLARFEAHLIGDGAIAQGTGATAVGRQATLIAGDVGGAYIAPGGVKIVHPSAMTPPAGLREAYLSWVMEQVRTVPLAGVDSKSVREETRRDLELAAVYTAPHDAADSPCGSAAAAPRPRRQAPVGPGDAERPRASRPAISYGYRLEPRFKGVSHIQATHAVRLAEECVAAMTAEVTHGGHDPDIP